MGVIKKPEEFLFGGCKEATVKTRNVLSSDQDRIEVVNFSARKWSLSSTKR